MILVHKFPGLLLFFCHRRLQDCYLALFKVASHGFQMTFFPLVCMCVCVDLQNTALKGPVWERALGGLVWEDRV